MQHLLLGLVVLLASSTPANAWIYVGSATVKIVAHRPAGDIVSAVVDLERVRIHKCGGGYDDYMVNASIDAAAGWDITVPGGDYCGVSFGWDSPMAIEANTWAATYAEPTTSVTLDGTPTVWVGLTPFEVVSGSFSGGPPRLYVTVE